MSEFWNNPLELSVSPAIRELVERYKNEKPSVSDEILSAQKEISSQKEFPIQSNETLICFGDSITESPQGGYVEMLQLFLDARFPDRKIKVINSGIGGHKITSLLERVDRDVIQKKPEWVSVMIGVNDVWHGVNGVPLEEYLPKLDKLVSILLSARIHVILLSTTVINEDLSSEENHKLAGYNLAIQAVAEKYSLIPVHMRKIFMDGIQKGKAANPDFSLTRDGVHPNPVGHTLITYEILKALHYPKIFDISSKESKASANEDLFEEYRSQKTEITPEDLKAQNDGIPDEGFMIQKNQKLVCLGDSVTFAEGGYVQMVLNLVSAVYPERNIQVINAGIGSNNARHLLDRVEQDVFSQNPDWVLINVGLNDCGGSSEKTLTLPKYMKILDQLVQTILKKHIHLALANATVLGEDLENDRNLKLREYNLAMKEVCMKYNLPLVPFNECFTEAIRKGQKADSQFKLTLDGVHPNSTGHELLAMTFLEKLRF